MNEKLLAFHAGLISTDEYTLAVLEQWHEGYLSPAEVREWLSYAR